VALVATARILGVAVVLTETEREREREREREKVPYILENSEGDAGDFDARSAQRGMALSTAIVIAQSVEWQNPPLFSSSEARKLLRASLFLVSTKTTCHENAQMSGHYHFRVSSSARLHFRTRRLLALRICRAAVPTDPPAT
jgi:hypothetical protein